MGKMAIAQSEMAAVHGGEDISAPIIYAVDAPEFPLMAEDLRHNRRNSCRRSAASYG